MNLLINIENYYDEYKSETKYQMENTKGSKKIKVIRNIFKTETVKFTATSQEIWEYTL